MKLSTVRLETLAGGALVELFDHELGAVLKDIESPNTSATATRRITLEVSIKPAENRESAAVIVSSRCKLAGVKPSGTLIYLARKGGELVAVAADPRQLTIPVDELEVVKGEGVRNVAQS